MQTFITSLEKLFGDIITSKGLERLSMSEELASIKHNKTELNIPFLIQIPLRLRKIECWVYLEQLIKTCVKEEDYKSAAEFAEARQVLCANEFKISLGEHERTITSPVIFSEKYGFMWDLVERFCETKIIDRDNDIYLINGNKETSLRRIIASLKLKDDEPDYNFDTDTFTDRLKRGVLIELVSAIGFGSTCSLNALNSSLNDFAEIFSEHKNQNTIFIILETKGKGHKSKIQVKEILDFLLYVKENYPKHEIQFAHKINNELNWLEANALMFY